MDPVILALLMTVTLPFIPASWQHSRQPVGGELAASWQPVAATSCVPTFRDPERGGMPQWKKDNVTMIRRVFAGESKKVRETAVAVAYAEHGLNCTGVSPTNDHGLFQLNGIPEYDCQRNAQIAYSRFYLRRGFQPWSAFKSGRYKRYLTCQ